MAGDGFDDDDDDDPDEVIILFELPDCITPFIFCINLVAFKSTFRSQPSSEMRVSIILHSKMRLLFC